LGALEGRRILITRPPDEAEELADRLRAAGAIPIEAPAIEIRPVDGAALDRLDAAVRELASGRFAWVVFTSVRAVDAVLGRVGAQGLGPFPSSVRARVAAVGSATADRLEAAGIGADLVPEAFTTTALVESFSRGSGRVLTPRADVAPEGLEDGLAGKGWEPTRVDAYRTVFPEGLPVSARRALERGEVDALAFTSSSTVRGFVTMAGVRPDLATVCIGPVTAQAARDAGFDVQAVAEPHTIEGLVRALERMFGEDPSR
jgi:uroporphyrinogen III methyltransferase / synthase